MSDRHADGALQGRVAVVTGGASGIGLATVTMLARAGCSVALAFHPGHPYDGEAVAAAARRDGLDVHAYPVDVTDAAQIATTYGAVRTDLGRPAIVVANASIAPRVGIAVSDLTTWDRVIDVNLSGAYRTLSPAIPDMIAARWGRLMVTSSVSGPIVGWPEHAAYCASKAGLVGLVRSLAVDLAPHGITVNAVAPGLIRTPMSTDEVNSLGAQRLAQVGAAIPVGRVGEAVDVASAFAYLASPGAGYITGQVLTVDGGSTIVEAV